jgi:hypothetical protein
MVVLKGKLGVVRSPEPDVFGFNEPRGYPYPITVPGSSNELSP